MQCQVVPDKINQTANNNQSDIYNRLPAQIGDKPVSEFRSNGNPEIRRRNRFFEFAFDPKTGAISFLKEVGGRILADSRHKLGIFIAENFSSADYRRFLRQYLRSREMWAQLDFGKPFLPSSIAHKEGCAAGTVFEEISPLEFRFRLIPPLLFGMPRQLQLSYRFQPDRPEIDVTFEWFGKEPARLPHALWLSFTPRNPESWKLRKTGEWIDSGDVVHRGGRNLHAIDRFVECAVLRVESLEAVLVAPGKRSLLDFNDLSPNPEEGIHFNLYNNVWGTNFPMWMDGNLKFRFRLLGAP